MKEKRYLKDKVTVVVPVYNEEQYLRQALESVVEQVDCVIIGDNASADGTEAICREFMEKYSHIKYFRNDKNLGIYENIRLCIIKVQTEFFFHLDGHDTIPPNFVLSMKKRLIETPDALGVYSDRHEVSWDGSLRVEPIGTFNERLSIFCKDIVDEKGRSWPEYSMLPSPMERAACVYLSTYPDNYWFSLYRTAPTLLYWKKLIPHSVSIFYIILLNGKMVYCDDTVYYHRDTHPDDSLNKMLERASGDNYSESVQIHSDSMEKILNLFVNTTDVTLDNDEKWILFSRLYMRLKQIYGYKSLKLHCDQRENAFLLRKLSKMTRYDKARSILGFFCTVIKQENKTQYKFFNGPSFSIRASKRISE